MRIQNYKEDDQFYHLMYESGVDFFCTDYPLRALEVRKRYE
jgi:glycerophosphoryl diester phosphodiesterase